MHVDGCGGCVVCMECSLLEQRGQSPGSKCGKNVFGNMNDGHVIDLGASRVFIFGLATRLTRLLRGIADGPTESV